MTRRRRQGPAAAPDHQKPILNAGFASDYARRLTPGRLQAALVKLKIRATATPVSTGPVATVNQRESVHASFDATTGAIDGFNQLLCQSCHMRAQAWEDLFTRPELLAFAQNVTPQYFVCQLTGLQPCHEPNE